MAIQTNFTTENGIELTDAYFRVEHIRVIRELRGEFDVNDLENDPRTKHWIVRARVHVYQSDPGRQGRSIEDLTFDKDLEEVEALEGDTLIDKVYAWLVTEERFSTGVNA